MSLTPVTLLLTGVPNCNNLGQPIDQIEGPTHYQVKLQLMLRLSWAVTIKTMVVALLVGCDN